MNKVFFTADWHLAEGAWKHRPEIYGDALESLRRLCAVCDSRDYICAAGDLFDTKYPSSDVVVTAEQNMQLQKLYNPILFIQGQHEKSKIPWMKLFHANHINGGSYMLTPNIRLFAFDWSLGLHLQANLDKIGDRKNDSPPLANGMNILMLHQTCNAVMAGMDANRDKKLDALDYRACELRDGMLPPGFDMVIVGDTHEHTEFQLRDRTGRLVKCYSPGSFAMQSLSETNTGQCFVFDTQTREMTSMDLYRRPYKEVFIDTPVEFDKEIRDRIKTEPLEHFDIPIIKYTLYENDAERISSLKQACAGNAFPFFYFIDKDKADSTTNVATALQSTDDLISVAIKEAEVSNDAKKLLNDLISSNSADEVLDSYYKTLVLRSKC